MVKNILFHIYKHDVKAKLTDRSHANECNGSTSEQQTPCNAAVTLATFGDDNERTHSPLLRFPVFLTIEKKDDLDIVRVRHIYNIITAQVNTIPDI